MGPCLRIRRKSFTLIEMVIVMTLLLMIAGIGGFSLSRALKSQAFFSQADALVSRLNRSLDILMLLNIETDVTIEKGSVRQIPVGTISDAYLQMLQREKQSFQDIKKFTFESFDGETMVAGQEGGKIVLSFLDRGFRLPYGLLTLESDRGDVRYILFRGFPEPLRLTSDRPDWFKESQEIKAYNEQLTQSTWVAPDV